MNGFLNVRDLPSPLTSAVGDGCTNDRPAIQAALCALARLWSDTCGATAVHKTCTAPGRPYNASWPEYAAGLYFPAGIYRIDAPLDIPWLINVRLFGDGGRGGQGYGDIGAIPFGSVIRQDMDAAPIFHFRDTDTAGVTIERLGFTWANRQESPSAWQPGLALDEPQSSGYTDPGAIALLFSARRARGERPARGTTRSRSGTAGSSGGGGGLPSTTRTRVGRAGRRGPSRCGTPTSSGAASTGCEGRPSPS